MKYKYIIFAQGDYEEERIIEKLNELELEEIFVEKFRDIDAIVADQNNFIDENFDAKFERLVADGIFPSNEMVQRIAAVFADENKKTMRDLFKAMQDVGVAMDLPNYRIEKIVCRAIELLNNN